MDHVSLLTLPSNVVAFLFSIRCCPRPKARCCSCCCAALVRRLWFHVKGRLDQCTTLLVLRLSTSFAMVQLPSSGQPRQLLLLCRYNIGIGSFSRMHRRFRAIFYARPPFSKRVTILCGRSQNNDRSCIGLNHPQTIETPKETS